MTWKSTKPIAEKVISREDICTHLNWISKLILLFLIPTLFKATRRKDLKTGDLKKFRWKTARCSDALSRSFRIGLVCWSEEWRCWCVCRKHPWRWDTDDRQPIRDLHQGQGSRPSQVRPLGTGKRSRQGQTRHCASLDNTWNYRTAMLWGLLSTGHSARGKDEVPNSPKEVSTASQII